MNDKVRIDWYETNQQYLVAALAQVRRLLEQQATRCQGVPEVVEPGEQAQRTAPEITADMPAPPALATLCEIFDLSPFERNVLLLCAGMELSAEFAPLCASAQSDPSRPYPTFSLAMAVFPGAHWSAITPSGPLRDWRLIEAEAGRLLTLSPLRIDERILHYLLGLHHLDERLTGMMTPLSLADELVPSHQALAERVAAAWANPTDFPIIQLCGGEVADKLAIAAAACDLAGGNLWMLPAPALPTNPIELGALQRLWQREAALSKRVLLLRCEDGDTADPARDNAISQFVETSHAPLIVSGDRRRALGQRPMVTFDVPKPTTIEQRIVWGNALGTVVPSPNGQIDRLLSQFNLSPSAIRAACASVTSQYPIVDDQFTSALWDACRIQTRPRLDDLAQRIESAVSWDDLVLPETQRRVLREIAIHVRQRTRVYETWGFAHKSSRGLGISALFVGVSGTGKTLAAEVLANELCLDLYRIDLSGVVSKYIGETEKNLKRVFDAAETGGVILLFDEADALFGRRSEVKDSHDRYANIEISYLLQRMEAYQGLSILTTNMREALDTAFLRRIRFVVQFPFPDADLRAEIWQRTFPDSVPIEGLDINKLAKLSVPGGNIHNIALHAAFLAADAGESVRMPHLLRAARVEYAKLEKALTTAEIGDWT